VVLNKGRYEYAIRTQGKLLASGVPARNAADRNAAERGFLRHLPNSLKPDFSATDAAVFTNTLSGSATPTTESSITSGTMKALLILIKYPDLPNTFTTGQFTNLMNQANYRGTGSFKDFYMASSAGKLNVTTDVFGWYTAKNNYQYYGRQNGWTVSTTLVREAVNAAEAAGIDFSQYDNDKDGKVDGIIVAHAGPGAEEGSQSQYIWSHRWILSAGANQVTYDGVLIDDYMITPERRLYTNDMVGRGIFCHEFGHNLGLPDLYDTDGGSEGAGEWSLMASASWLGNEHTPGNMCAWSRSMLGWITPQVLSGNGAYSLLIASKSSQAYRINTPLSNEYFLLENRQKSGLDISLKGSGLAIWHINTSKTSMYPGSNYVNADEDLKGVDLEEADGLNHLDNQNNRGDDGDLFPGSTNKTVFNESTRPGSLTYTNASTGINIHHITVDGEAKIWFTLGTVSPLLSSFSPLTGVTGTLVKITGVGFSGATAVSFNAVNAVFSVINDYTIQATVPAGASTGLIRICLPSGTITSKISFVVETLVAGKPWDKSFGGNYADNFTAIIPASDGGYLLGGYSLSGINGDKTEASRGSTDFWIVKTDESGNKLWDKRFGGSASDIMNALIQTSDGGYLLGGHSSSGTGGDKSEPGQGGRDYWIVKISNTGIRQWDRRFGGLGNEDLRTLIQTPDGYLLAGYSNSTADGDKSQITQGGNDYWVVKLNLNGVKVWDKRFGGSGDDFLEGAIALSDGSFILAGRSASGISGDRTESSRGGRDYWLVKITSSGSKIWDKRFGGSSNDELYAIGKTTSGNIYVGGFSASIAGGDKSQASRGGNDFWMLLLNDSGVKLWDKRFGGIDNEELRALIQTADGGFLLGGKSASGISGDKTENIWGSTDYWLVKIDASGNKQWDKRFGGGAADELRSILQTKEGAYLLGGRTDSDISGDKSQASRGSTDYWLVKMPPVTTSTVSASSARLAVANETAHDTQLNVYPNPFQNNIQIRFSVAVPSPASLKVYDLQGEKIAELINITAEPGEMYTIHWQPTGLKPGLYVLQLTTRLGSTYKKVMSSP
jgi:M6 family metalloprotease-like protein